MSAPKYSIEVAPTGFASLKSVRDKKILREIAKAIDGLSNNPGRQGKTLLKPLEGLRSIRAVRNGYRIVYKVDDEARIVSVLLLGERKAGQEDDVYALAQKLLRTLMGGS